MSGSASRRSSGSFSALCTSRLHGAVVAAYNEDDERFVHVLARNDPDGCFSCGLRSNSLSVLDRGGDLTEMGKRYRYELLDGRCYEFCTCECRIDNEALSALSIASAVNMRIRNDDFEQVGVCSP